MPANIWNFLEGSLNRYPEHPAWIERCAKGAHDIVSYQQLRRRACKQSQLLTDQGVVKGDIVAIFANNGADWTVAALAIWRLGAIIGPLHIGNSDDELRQQQQVLKPKITLFAGNDRGLVDLLEITRQEVGLSEIVSDAVATRPDDEAVRIYTSGSTGNPKMVRLTHNNLTSNTLGLTQLDIGIDHTDRFLLLLPLSHAMGLVGGFLMPIYCGSSIILPRVLAANEVLDSLKQEKITIMIAVPRLFRNIMLGIDKKFARAGRLLQLYRQCLPYLPLAIRRRLNFPIRNQFGGKIKVWISGGSRLDPEIAQYFRNLGFPLRQGYGLTECSPVVSMQSDFDPLLEGVGKPIADVEVRIENPDQQRSGKLWVKGPNVMKGYVDDEQTASVIKDGWYDTGDIAKLVDGRIVLTGRSKRLIVTEAGKNVYPEDIEIMLERHLDLAEAGVVEVDMRAAVVLAIAPPNQPQKAKQIIGDYNQRASSHNQIVRYAVVDELPRTPLGKVALQKLQGLFNQHEVK